MLIAGSASAQTQSADAIDKTDKSGTNPLNLQQKFEIGNEFNSIDSAARINYTRYRYTDPLGDDFSLRLEVPLVYSSAAIAGDSTEGGGDGSSPALVPSGASRDVSRFGLGDMVLKADYIPYITRSGGLKLSAELGAPTATSPKLGTGKWTIAPTLSYGFFLPDGMIFAPAYKQALSFAGDLGAMIDKGTFDLYFVIKFDKGQQWVTFDPTYNLDYQSHKYTGATMRVTYGHQLGELWGGTTSAYIKPGIGIGQDKPYAWSIEAGISLVGF